MIVALLEVAVYVKKLFADSAYAGPKLHDALKELGVSELIEIVPKPKGAKGFTVLSRRRVLERTFAWMGRCRRLAKDVDEDCGKFSGLGEAGRMSVHDAAGRSAPKTTHVFGNRRLMTLGTDSKAKVDWSRSGSLVE